MPSKDGKGRTLYEILTGRNKRDLTPLELQYHNPLGAKVGCFVNIDNDPDLGGINFVIERMSIYETKIKERKFYHTDYHLRGTTLDRDRPIRLRLRLIPDEDETNRLGCKVQVLRLYDEMEWDAGFHDNVLMSESGIFDVNYDDAGVELAEPRRYWRVEDVLDPYHARVTVLCDKDGNGKVEENEVERIDVTYWDYHRNTDDAVGQEFTEFLSVEMNDRSHYFTFLRGREVGAFQISVI
jgi:hypothetical protein